MTDLEKPKRFKFHLSTAVAVSIAAGFWLHLNFTGWAVEGTNIENAKGWGWPFGLSLEGLIKRGQEKDCENLLNGRDKLRRINGDDIETLVKEPSGQISFKQVTRSPTKYVHACLNLALGMYFCLVVAKSSEWLIRRREAHKT